MRKASRRGDSQAERTPDPSIIRPYPVDGLTFVRASHKSLYGTIRSNWKRENDVFALDVSVPVNSSATVYVPVKDGNVVNESGQPADKAKGVRLVRNENGMAVYNVDSGSYSFASKL